MVKIEDIPCLVENCNIGFTVHKKSMDDAPKDGTPILAFTKHDADPYHLDDYRLTDYGSWCEGYDHAKDGYNMVYWQEGFYESIDDFRTYWIPGVWMVANINSGIPANPIFWVDLAGL